MAPKKKTTPKKPPRRQRWKLALSVVGVLALGVGALHVNASVVHVRYANVNLEDLPTEFDGTRILFASDIDLCGLNTAQDAGRLFQKLQALHPDLLLLGGDYASPSLIERLNGRTGQDEAATRQAFFDSIANFHAPLGKFAVSGDNDGPGDALKIAMMASGASLIDGGLQIIEKDGARIGIAGIGEDTQNVSALAGHVGTKQCVIALMHRPSKIVDVRIAESKDGGPWVDLALAGHTHGGQIRIGDRSLLTLDETEKRSISGWSTDGGPMLVTSGVGCESVNLRLGSQAEVWLITLHSK